MIWSREKGPQITLEVEGMRCANCEGSVRIALRKNQGVRKIKIVKRKQIIVELKPSASVTRGDLVAAIENAGYTVVG